MKNTETTNGQQKDDCDVVQNGSVPDPFAIESLRLGQDFGETLGVKKLVTTIPCGKPGKHEFVRVRPGEVWRIETAVLFDTVNSETYLVLPELRTELGADLSLVCIRLAINAQGDVRLWPLKMPGLDGRSNAWWQSAAEAAALAEEKWIRVVANQGAGHYDVFEATGKLPDPTWPDLTLQELLNRAFGDRRIESLDHPILRTLRGEIA